MIVMRLVMVRRRSVRHEHRDGHVAEDLTADAAQDELAEARVTVGPHRDEIGAEVGGL